MHGFTKSCNRSRTCDGLNYDQMPYQLGDTFLFILSETFEPSVGIEPTTCSLQVNRSTN